MKTGDLDLQGQIGLETNKFCVIPCECDKHLNRVHFNFKLELCIDHLKVFDYSKNF